jgi:DNA-directed RNA polymerase III subunit RPC1
LVNRGLYNEKMEPVPYGPLDLRLGVNEKGKTCETCFKKIADCPGHFGYVRLDIPIFHIGYFKYIISILNCVCKECSRILLKKDDKEKFRKILKKKNLSTPHREKVFRNVVENCKKIKKCEYCGAVNGFVKHAQGTDATLIVHDKYK